MSAATEDRLAPSSALETEASADAPATRAEAASDGQAGTGADSDRPPPGAGLHPLLHTPVRLQVCAGLCAVNEAEFAVLRDLTGVSDSVLSKHLSQLEADGLIGLRKAVSRGRRRTWISLTRDGRRITTEHLETLARLAEASRAALGRPG